MATSTCKSAAPPPASVPAPYQLYCGIDISAATFTASVTTAPSTIPSKACCFDQDAAGFAAFESWLSQWAGVGGAITAPAPQQILVVLEATGVYWQKLAGYLVDKHLAVSVINPKQSANFAKILKRRAKTDALDAQMLAQLAATLQPALWRPPAAIYQELYQRLMLRQALLDVRKQFTNQLLALRHKSVVVEVEQELLAELKHKQAQLKALEKRIQALIGSEPDWSKSYNLLLTLPGMGWVSAVWLLVITHNFTACQSAEQLSSYLGLAPVERTSGTSLRPRPQLGQGGHKLVRSVLYMAARSAILHNPVVAAYAARLQNGGKPPKVVRLAAARKLVHLAVALVSSGKAFDPAYQAKPHTRQRQEQAAGVSGGAIA